MKKNYISVLLPVYNAEKFLAETLDSLLRQTYIDFEVVAINDGSVDDSLKILKRYAEWDSRIKVHTQQNQGLVKTLNKAATLAEGEFLARIDADDVALPRRFELQIKQLKKDSSIVLLGGGFDVMNEDGEILYHDAVPTNPTDLLNAMYTRNPLAHGSIMMRTNAFQTSGGYSPDCGPTEDYDLWVRLSNIGKVAALKQTIFRWRVNSTGITSTQSKAVESYMDSNLQKYNSLRPYKIVKRSALKQRLNNYVETDLLHGNAMKEKVLQDVINAAILLVKRRQYLRAFTQLSITASTGRTGLRLTRQRLAKIAKYRLNK